MLSHVSIENYQSLHAVEIDLEPFTVIVGQSSSGKSAFTRALRLLTSNARGASFITTGKTSCRVEATTERGAVSITRHKSGSDKDKYALTLPDTLPKEWSKLGGNVPEEVTEFLGIPPKNPIQYAGQFDSPFLLSETGSTVAGTLGELTNVSRIFDAARESNRVKLETTKSLNTRAGDLGKLLEQAKEFADLKPKREAIARAEARLTAAKEIQSRIARLSAVIGAIEGAESRLEGLRAYLDLPVPDIGPALEIVRTQRGFSAVVQDLTAAANRIKIARAQTVEYSEERRELEELYAETLRQAGTCPVCGQDTKHLEGVAHD